MNIKHSLVIALVVSISSSLVPAHVWAAEHLKSSDVTTVTSPTGTAGIAFQTAIRDAVSGLEPTVVTSPRGDLAPRARRTTSTAAVRRQGGGGMGAVIGLVSLVAGLGMTYYMVKQMKKDDPASDGQ